MQDRAMRKEDNSPQGKIVTELLQVNVHFENGIKDKKIGDVIILFAGDDVPSKDKKIRFDNMQSERKQIFMFIVTT